MLALTCFFGSAGRPRFLAFCLPDPPLPEYQQHSHYGKDIFSRYDAETAPDSRRFQVVSSRGKSRGKV